MVGMGGWMDGWSFCGGFVSKVSKWWMGVSKKHVGRRCKGIGITREKWNEREWMELGVVLARI